jgi:charged multivesicular body protein 2B
MSSLFGKKKDLKEEMRDQNKVLRSAQRDIDRDKVQMEREKKRIELEIKKAAKEGNKQACTVLAKQLINMRKAENRQVQASSRIAGVKTQTQVMASNVKMAEAMKKTTDTMVNMNKLQDPMKTAQIMKEFQAQNMKMEMSDEMINDTLDGVLEGSDDEAEGDAIVNKVLDEIGIEMTGKLINAPTPGKNNPGTSLATNDDDLVDDKDIQDMLSKLKA